MGRPDFAAFFSAFFAKSRFSGNFPHFFPHFEGFGSSYRIFALPDFEKFGHCIFGAFLLGPDFWPKAKIVVTRS